MTIRFQCGACAQPIEIDDEWASKTVACPYCRKTVVAPAESTLDEKAPVPMASAYASPPNAPGQYAVPAGTGASNRVAVAALVLGITTLAMFYGARTILVAHSLQLQELMKAAQSSSSFAQNMEAQQKFFEQYPDAPQWLAPAGLLGMGSLLTWVATLVCGIIGIRRPVRRGMASSALVIAALVPILFCSGV